MASSPTPTEQDDAPPQRPRLPFAPPRSFNLRINGQTHIVGLEPRVPLLDALRETLQLTGTNKAAIANAVCHGRRVRNLPITLDKLQ